MGSLKSKKKIHVSATAYNLAGDYDKRNNFLKNTVLAIVTSPRDLYIGETLSRAYLNGPGIRFRNFARWAKNSGYTDDVIKQTGGTITLPANVDHSIIARHINPSAPGKVNISLAELGIVEYNYWAMQYMMENHPNDLEGNWASSFDDDTGEVVIHFYADAEQEEEVSQVRFIPADYIKEARYVYASYSISQDGTNGPIEEGPTYVHDEDNPPPSTVGWTNISTNSVQITYSLPNTVHTLVEYSDGTPSEESTVVTPDTAVRTKTNSEWEKTTYLGSHEYEDDSVGNRKEFLYLTHEHEVDEVDVVDVETVDIGEGVIKTTTTTVTISFLKEKSYSRVDVQVNKLKGWSPIRLMIYRENSGNPEMDSQFQPPVSFGEFFPFIPIRLWNRFLSETYLSDEYERSTKALKKGLNYKFDDIRKSLETSDSLGDIDHAFVTFGVALNTQENAGKRYIYQFFQQLLEGQAGFGYLEWESTFLEAIEKQAIWREWRLAQDSPGDPLFGTPEPEYIEVPYAPASSIRLVSKHPSIDYDMTISWSSMTEELGTGLYKQGAKIGDIEITQGAGALDQLVVYTGLGEDQKIPVDWRDPIHITWQYRKNAYRRLSIRGLNHRNIVYKGKSVSISGRDALKDTEESGFIVPLHTQLHRSLPLVQTTQMSQSCAYIVLNSWQVTKQKWYQTKLFKIILVVVVIVVTVFTGGAGAGGAGILGANASVGATIGFTGTAAIIAGAVANAVAAIIVAQVITAGATALLGDKWGSIIGAIASMVVLNMASSYQSGGGWSINYQELTKADNLLKLTDSIGKGISHDTQMKAMKKFEETEAIIADYEEQSKRIAELYTKNIGDGQGIDLIAIQEIASRFDFNYEAPTDFLTRTLMTGTDIVELSQSLIDDFANITTSLNLS